MAKFGHSVVGGTFDRLHPGHRKYLEETFEKSESVSIGLTSDAYIARAETKKELKELIMPYDERKRDLEKYLEDKGYSGRSRVFGIDDDFGDTLSNESYDAIFVAEEKGVEIAGKINSCRQDAGLKPLEIVQIRPLLGPDGGRLSSARIRRSLAVKTQG